VKSREASTYLANSVALVDARVVPDENYVTTKVAKEMGEKIADFVVTDVLGMDSKIQAHAPPFRRDADSRDDGEAIMPVAVVNDRRLPPRRPRLAKSGNQQEARLVGEDYVGTQPRSVFFTLGQSLSFQRATRSSSRSRARRSGFWWLQPSSRMRRPIWSR